MKTRVSIIVAERRESVYEGGKKSISYTCQCIVHGEKMEVGVLRVPLALAEPYLKDDQLPTGDYELEYGLSVSYKNRDLEGRLKAIAPAAAMSAVGRADRNNKVAAVA